MHAWLAELRWVVTDPQLPHRGGDGPSSTILRFMKDYNYSAPPSWQGFRALTEK